MIIIQEQEGAWKELKQGRHRYSADAQGRDLALAGQHPSALR